LLAKLPDYALPCPFLYCLSVERREDCCEHRNHKWHKRQRRADCHALTELGLLPYLALEALVDKSS
jgi:hypothetical protein